MLHITESEAGLDLDLHGGVPAKDPLRQTQAQKARKKGFRDAIMFRWRNFIQRDTRRERSEMFELQQKEITNT